MVDSWSRAPDQIQMYPDRDTITQLLPAWRFVSLLFKALTMFKGKLSRCSARANLTGFFHRKKIELPLFVASCRRDKVTDKRYLYPIRHSHSSLNYRKKGQLAELVREKRLVFFVLNGK